MTRCRHCFLGSREATGSAAAATVATAAAGGAANATLGAPDPSRNIPGLTGQGSRLRWTRTRIRSRGGRRGRGGGGRGQLRASVRGVALLSRFRGRKVYLEWPAACVDSICGGTCEGGSMRSGLRRVIQSDRIAHKGLMIPRHMRSPKRRRFTRLIRLGAP